MVRYASTRGSHQNQKGLALFLYRVFFHVDCESPSIGHNHVRNRLLLFGALAAQAVHIGAMYTPGLREVLGIAPAPFAQWLELLAIALGLLLLIELHERLWNRRWHNSSN